MARIRLVLEYDGTEFAGWQMQPNGRTVQEELERGLATLLGAPVRVLAAGRTDAGVHALGQVACFDTDRALPLKAYARGLNGHLPPDLAVIRAEEVAPDFDPRRWSLGKHYRYRISNLGRRSPLRRRTHWELFGALDVEAMREATRPLIGRHDFSAFRAADCEAANPFREVRSIRIDGEPGDALVIDVEGTAFLKHMVRNLVGTLVEVGKGRRDPAWIAEVLASRDRSRAGATAPAHGLALMQVFYGAGRPAHLSGDDEDDE